MAGYSSTPLAKKLGIKEGSRIGLVNAPKGFESELGELPENAEFVARLTKSLDIASVPLVVVNGKYMTSVSEAGGAGQLIALINDLAAGEKSR